MINNVHLRYLVWATCLLLAGCGSVPQQRDRSTQDKINSELRQAVDGNKPRQQVPDAVSNALLPPLRIAVPKVSAKQLEQRFDLVVNDAPASQVFMGVVSGTRYSMLVHPDVKGSISVNLKDVTVFEALDAIRDLYGYEYRVDGSRILVEPVALQTRVFQVNYISGQRTGVSDTRVISNTTNSTSGSSGTTGTGTSTTSPSTGSTSGRGVISSSIHTQSTTDFWPDLTTALSSIIGNADGRKVIVNAQAGIVLVRAMPAEIRSVEKYLRVMQLNIERQVILEAKIVEVQLNDQSQAGVNWAVFGSSARSRVTIGNVDPNTYLGKGGSGLVSSGTLASTGGAALANAAATGGVAGSLFAIAFHAANFASLISFLESQGDVHVLSSPRIATINNQQAVLKVGTDEFFVTGVSTSTIASTGATTTVPEVTLSPFFSGIALDVTPQIDENNNITLHIHPSVSDVSTVTKQVNIGTGQTISLPLASSKISETDSIVRARDGQVVAIGGLMKQSTTSDRSKVPGLGDVKGVGAAFRQHDQITTKSELVILLKPTVVQSENDWSDDILATQRRIENLDRPAEPNQ